MIPARRLQRRRCGRAARAFIAAAGSALLLAARLATSPVAASAEYRAPALALRAPAGKPRPRLHAARYGGQAEPRARSQSQPVDAERQAKASCGSCHAFPPPDILPRERWRDEFV